MVNITIAIKTRRIMGTVIMTTNNESAVGKVVDTSTLLRSCGVVVGVTVCM